MSEEQIGGIDLSAAIEKVKEMMSGDDGQEKLNSIISAFAGSTDSGGDKKHQTIADEAADFETMVKLSGVMSKMKSQESSREAALLYAIKPFLRESRQAKTDSAVKIIGMLKALKTLKDSGFDFGF